MNRITSSTIIFLFTIFLLTGLGANCFASIVTLDEANLQRVHDTNADGIGDSRFGSPANNLVGFFADSAAVQNMQMVWAFQMTGVADPATIINADFTATVTGLGSNAFNIDAHVIRTAGTDTILASDYEGSANLLTEDFNGANAVGAKSLDVAGQTALTSFLQNNWVENQFVFIGLKTDPLTLAGSNDFFRFDAAATLMITVPEPNSLVLLGSCILFVSRRRK